MEMLQHKLQTQQQQQQQQQQQRQLLPELWLFVGLDCVPTIHQWYEGERLLRTTRFLLIDRQCSSGCLSAEQQNAEPAAAAAAAGEADECTSARSSEVYKQLERMHRFAVVNFMLRGEESICLLPAVSSSLLRAKLHRRKEGPQQLAACLSLTPAAVIEYIERQGLYLSEM
ncbi:hypothetical protein Esti_005992 [Eimeria stiedai]